MAKNIIKASEEVKVNGNNITIPEAETAKKTATKKTATKKATAKKTTAKKTVEAPKTEETTATEVKTADEQKIADAAKKTADQAKVAEEKKQAVEEIENTVKQAEQVKKEEKADTKTTKENTKENKNQPSTAVPQSVRKIVIFGKEIDYDPGMKHTFKQPNLRNEYEKTISGKFAKGDADSVLGPVAWRGYELTFARYDKSVVCSATKDGKLFVNNVSVATLIDVLVDDINEAGTTLKWGRADQEIKLVRGLKSNIKSLVPKNETGKATEAKKSEEPKAEEPKAEEPKAEEPKAEVKEA